MTETEIYTIINPRLDKKLWYFATPYSRTKEQELLNMSQHEAEKVNYQMALYRTNRLLDMGYRVYTPVVFTHHLHDHKFREYEDWMNLDETIRKRCDGIILSIGWEMSEGCKQELKKFEDERKPVLKYKDLIFNRNKERD